MWPPDGSNGWLGSTQYQSKTWSRACGGEGRMTAGCSACDRAVVSWDCDRAPVVYLYSRVTYILHP